MFWRTLEVSKPLWRFSTHSTIFVGIFAGRAFLVHGCEYLPMAKKRNLNLVKQSRRRLFAIPFVGVVAFTLAASAILEVVLRDWYVKKFEQDIANVIDTTLRSVVRIDARVDEIPVIVESVGLVATKYRITVVDIHGEVIADSRYLAGTKGVLPNALVQPEVAAALTRGIGSATRRDSLAGLQTYFYARKFKANHFEGVIRVGQPVEEYQSAIEGMRLLLASLAVAALIFMASLVFVFNRFLSRTIELEQSLLSNRVKERTRDIYLLHRFTNMLAASASLEEIQLVVDDILPRILKSRRGAVSLMNDARDLLHVRLQWQGEWVGESEFPPGDCWAMRKGKYHLSHDRYSDQRCYHMGENQCNTLCIPLLAHGNTLGLLHIVVEEDFGNSEDDIVFTVAEHLGLALSNLAMQERLRHQALRDPLTGLYNRRYFEEAFNKELSRSQRQQTPCGLLMIDIDHFKAVNDSFGHDVGDYVLRSLGHTLNDGLRSQDTVCRLGGEEFVVILPDASLTDSMTCAKKLLHKVSDTEFMFHGKALGPVSISVGVVQYPTHGDSLNTILKAGDVALYKAKSNGRNRCEVAQDASKDVFRTLTLLGGNEQEKQKKN